MNFRQAGFCLSMIALIISDAAAARTVELAPRTPWNLHYDDDSCVLRRVFGTDEQYVQIDMRAFAPMKPFQAAIYGKGIKALNRIQKYRFRSTEKWRDGKAMSAIFAEDLAGAILDVEISEREDGGPDGTSLDELRAYAEADMTMASKIEAIELQISLASDLQLATGPLDQPLAAMRTCLDELQTHWGLDPRQQNNRKSAPVPRNLQAIGRMMAYPEQMIRQELPGIVNVRLDVSRDGRVSGCHIQVPLSNKAFEEYACSDLQTSMDFEPALDAEGEPIDSYWTTTVRYMLY